MQAASFLQGLLSMSEKVGILIVEDHAIVREGLRAILEMEPGLTVVGHASDGKEALERFKLLRPSVTLLDIHFPKDSGLDILRDIRAMSPSARILMISTFDHDEDVVKALQMGARGYILKDVDRSDLIAAVRAVHEGRKSIPAWVGDRLADMAGAVDLSDREREVLQLLADGRGNKEIARSLAISEGTIKAHLSHIFDKLRATDRTHAVLIALRRGIVHLG